MLPLFLFLPVTRGRGILFWSWGKGGSIRSVRGENNAGPVQDPAARYLWRYEPDGLRMAYAGQTVRDL